MNVIPYPIKLSIKNYLNDETWVMYSVDPSLAFSSQDLDKIISICNEPIVYDLLFKDKLMSKPYGLEQAYGFVIWAKKGWKEQTHFAYAIKDENNEIVAALDIKSNNLDEAEIGYWSSETKRGIMTNAIISLISIAKQVGYKKLFANTKKENNLSQGVLMRSGFSLENEFIKNGYLYFKFGKLLT